MKKYSFAAVLLLCGTSIAAAAPVAVRTMTVQPDQELRIVIDQTLSLDALFRVEISPKVAGRIASLAVFKGAVVTKGQNLAELEHYEQDAQLTSARAQVQSAQADVNRAASERTNAQTELKRYQRLQADGFSTQQQIDLKKTVAQSASAGLSSAQARLNQAKAEVTRAEAQRSNYFVVAPFDGTILNDYSLTPGASVAPSVPLFELADLAELKGTMKIAENRRYHVVPNMAVRITMDALPDETFMGYVATIDDFVSPATRTFNVEIRLKTAASGKRRLLPGMFGKAAIVLEECRDAFVVPQSIPLSRDGKTVVFVVRDGKALMKTVTTGLSAEGRVQITSGLDADDQVISFGNQQLNDGDEITILEGNGQS